jgi:hypothetical protein
MKRTTWNAGDVLGCFPSKTSRKMKPFLTSVVVWVVALSAVCLFAQQTPTAVEKFNLLRDSVRQAHASKNAASYLKYSQELSES